MTRAEVKFEGGFRLGVKHHELQHWAKHCRDLPQRI